MSQSILQNRTNLLIQETAPKAQRSCLRVSEAGSSWKTKKLSHVVTLETESERQSLKSSVSESRSSSSASKSSEKPQAVQFSLKREMNIRTAAPRLSIPKYKPMRKAKEQQATQELNLAPFLIKQRDSGLRSSATSLDSITSEGSSQFTALDYNIEILLERIREENFIKAASPGIKRLTNSEQRVSLTSEPRLMKTVSGAGSQASVPSSKFGQIKTSPGEQTLLKSEFQNSSHLKKLLLEEIAKAEDKCYERKELLAALTLASSKRRRADIQTIEGYLEQLPQFIKIKEVLEIEDLKEFARAIRLIHIKEFSVFDASELKACFLVKGIVNARKRNEEIKDWTTVRKEFESLVKWREEQKQKKRDSFHKVLQRKKTMLSPSYLRAKRSGCLVSPSHSPMNRRVSLKSTTSPHVRSAFRPVQKRSSIRVIQDQMMFKGKPILFENPVKADDLEKPRPSDPEAEIKGFKQSRISALKQFQWYLTIGEYVSGEDFSQEGEEEVQALALCDSKIAVLPSKLYERIVRKIERERYYAKLTFFRHVPCLKEVGMMLFKRLIDLFTPERINRGQVLYRQGQPADKVYVVFEGEFQIERRKQNKMTNKEMEYKKVRYLNDQRKPDIEKHHDMKTFKQLQHKDRKLSPTLIRLTTVGKGSMLGQEDVISERNYTSTVKCSSMTAQVFWIAQEQFLTEMMSKAAIWEAVVEDCLRKDEITKEKIISATHNKERYAQFFKKMQLRENWNQKHNFNIQQKQHLGDWRSAFKYIVKSKAFSTTTSPDPHPIPMKLEEPNEEAKSRSKEQKLKQTQQMKQTIEVNELSLQLLGNMGKNQKKQMVHTNNKIAQFIDTWDQVKLPSKKPAESPKKSKATAETPKPKWNQKKQLDRLKRIEQLEMDEFQSLQVRKNSITSMVSKRSPNVPVVNGSLRIEFQSSMETKNPASPFNQAPAPSTRQLEKYKLLTQNTDSVKSFCFQQQPPKKKTEYHRRLKLGFTQRQNLVLSPAGTQTQTPNYSSPKESVTHTNRISDVRSLDSSQESCFLQKKKIASKPMPLTVMMARTNKSRPATQGGIPLQEMKTLPVTSLIEFGINSPGDRRFVQAKTELRKEPARMSYDLIEKQKQTTVKIQEFMERLKQKKTIDSLPTSALNTPLTNPTSEDSQESPKTGRMRRTQFGMKARNIASLDVKVGAPMTPQTGLRQSVKPMLKKTAFGGKNRYEAQEEDWSSGKGSSSLLVPDPAPEIPLQWQRRFSKFRAKPPCALEVGRLKNSSSDSDSSSDSGSLSSDYCRLNSVEVESLKVL